MTEALDEKRIDDMTQFRQRRAAKRARQLADLMVRRPELQGVHPAADVASESILWSA